MSSASKISLALSLRVFPGVISECCVCRGRGFMVSCIRCLEESLFVICAAQIVQGELIYWTAVRRDPASAVCEKDAFTKVIWQLNECSDNPSKPARGPRGISSRIGRVVMSMGLRLRMPFLLNTSSLVTLIQRRQGRLSHFPANVTPPVRQALLGAYGGHPYNNS